MTRYLWALAGSGEMPFFGDDDGGRLFHPFGDRSRFARATLGACAAFLGDTPSHGDPRDLEDLAAWWLREPSVSQAQGSRASELFPDSGIATMVENGTELIASVRAFGRGRAGHSHAHALHFTLRRAGQPVLIDPGTYTYVSDPVWRNRFRGTAAHNTVRIDGLDQADPAGPFRWLNPPTCEILEWQASPWKLRARCRYRGLSHERRIFFQQYAVWVVDEIHGSGRHRIEQFWHPAGPVERIGEGCFQLAGGVTLLFPAGASVDIEQGGDHGWDSPVFGAKHPSSVVRSSVETELPCRLAAVFDLRQENAPLMLEPGRMILGARQLSL
jgi:hypothetical protein